MTRYATLTEDAAALGPSGRGITVPAGTYQVADLDGVDPDLLYLCDPAASGALLGCIPATDAAVEER